VSKVLVILADGFEELEAITVIDILRRAGIATHLAGLSTELVTGSHDIKITCDTTLAAIELQGFSHLFLPGGQPGTTNLIKNKRVLDLIKNFHSANKVIAAICAAPTVLHAAGILDGKRITSYPSERGTFTSSIYSEENVVRDKNIFTSRGIGTAIEFALTLVETICDRQTRMSVAQKILWPS
jgi:4-methyl-5(b-hydroxyethyl)-thiazole monophosphate biosynthesis